MAQIIDGGIGIGGRLRPGEGRLEISRVLGQRAIHTESDGVGHHVLSGVFIHSRYGRHTVNQVSPQVLAIIFHRDIAKRIGIAVTVTGTDEVAAATIDVADPGAGAIPVAIGHQNGIVLLAHAALIRTQNGRGTTSAGVILPGILERGTQRGATGRGSREQLFHQCVTLAGVGHIGDITIIALLDSTQADS